MPGDVLSRAMALELCKAPQRLLHYIRSHKVPSFKQGRNRFFVLEVIMPIIKKINDDYDRVRVLEGSGWVSLSDAAMDVERAVSTIYNWVIGKLLKSVRMTHKVYVCLEDVRKLSAVKRRGKGRVSLEALFKEKVELNEFDRLKAETLKELLDEVGFTLAEVKLMKDWYEELNRRTRQNRKDIGELYKFHGYYHIGGL